MTPNEKLLQLPASLPNDFESLILYYPKKFPKLQERYQFLVERYLTDPAGLRQYAKESVEKLTSEFRALQATQPLTENVVSLDELVELDARLHALYAFRFWLINYVLADGPVHEESVTNLAAFAGRLVVPSGDAVKDEQTKQRLVGELLQGTYADLYLQSALAGEAVLETIASRSEFAGLLKEVEQLIEAKTNDQDIYQALDPLVEAILADDPVWSEMRALLVGALYQVEFRQSRVPLYQTLIHHIEFNEANRELRDKQVHKQQRIEEIFTQAKQILSAEELADFQQSYEMVQVLSEAKDIMGEVDGELLPYWLRLLSLVEKHIQKEQPEYATGPIGPGGMFYELVWHLPDEYRARVFTPNNTSLT